MQESNKPEGLLDAHLTFLDNLRKSGKINMTGAAIHLEKSFKLTAELLRIEELPSKTP